MNFDKSEIKTGEKLYIRQMKGEEIRDCYHYYMERHFPQDELKPFAAIERMCQEGQYLCLGLYSDEETLPAGEAPAKAAPKSLKMLLGYAYLALPGHCDMALLDYLAIADDRRGKGYGSLILKELEKLLKDGYFSDCKGILIETEHEDYAADEEELAIRIRRNSFYQSNGVKASDLKVSAFEVPFRIWQIPAMEEAGYDCLAKNYEEIYIYMCGEEMARANVVVPL